MGHLDNIHQSIMPRRVKSGTISRHLKGRAPMFKRHKHTSLATFSPSPAIAQWTTTGQVGSFSVPMQAPGLNPFSGPQHHTVKASEFNAYSNPPESLQNLYGIPSHNNAVPILPAQNTFIARPPPMAPPETNTLPPQIPLTESQLKSAYALDTWKEPHLGWSRPAWAPLLEPINPMNLSSREAERQSRMKPGGRVLPSRSGVVNPVSGFSNALMAQVNHEEAEDAEYEDGGAVQFATPLTTPGHGVNSNDPTVEYIDETTDTRPLIFDDGNNFGGAVASSGGVYEPEQPQDYYTPIAAVTPSSVHHQPTTNTKEHPGGAVGPDGFSQQALAAQTTPPAPNGQPSTSTYAAALGQAGAGAPIPVDGSWTLGLVQPTLQDIPPAADTAVRPTGGTGVISVRTPSAAASYWNRHSGKGVTVFS